MELTQNALKDIVDYDPETGIMTWSAPRKGCVVGSQVGTVTRLGYRNVYIGGSRYMVHRLAWLYVHGVWPSGQIDHKNRNGLDNRISNLRVATSSQNQANKGMRSDNTSGVKGVTWDAERCKWLAAIHVNGKRIGLGRHDSIGDAAFAYREAAIKHFGDFANIEGK